MALVIGDTVATASGLHYELRNIIPRQGGRPTDHILVTLPVWVVASPIFDGLRFAHRGSRVTVPPAFALSYHLRTAALHLRRAEVRTAPPIGALELAVQHIEAAEAAGRDTSEMLARARRELNRLTTLDVEA